MPLRIVRKVILNQCRISDKEFVKFWTYSSSVYYYLRILSPIHFSNLLAIYLNLSLFTSDSNATSIMNRESARCHEETRSLSVAPRWPRDCQRLRATSCKNLPVPTSNPPSQTRFFARRITPFPTIDLQRHVKAVFCLSSRACSLSWLMV